MFYADPAFAQVFDLSFNAGKMFDDEPNKLIISSSTAERFFSDKEAIGRLLLFDGEFSFQAEVVGVFEDFPENTHLKGDFILSLATKEKLVPFDIADNWIWRSFYTYLELESG
ncbi:MAG: ABC transporter permease, partial [Bacteroidota bacterium]